MDSNPYTYKKNIVSQWGEDGIIEEIFKRIGTTSKLCVEFGAWDGKHFSNTWNLWNNHNWSAILIEGDAKRFKVLKHNTEHNNKITPVQAYVSIQGKNSLDRILVDTAHVAAVDLLSIDIDGDDYHIWKNLNHVTPRVVVIEHNPTVPPDSGSIICRLALHFMI